MEFHKHAKYRKYQDYYGIPNISGQQEQETRRASNFFRNLLVLTLISSLGGNGYLYLRILELRKAMPAARTAQRMAESEAANLRTELSYCQIRNDDLRKSVTDCLKERDQATNVNQQLLKEQKTTAMALALITDSLVAARARNAGLARANDHLRSRAREVMAEYSAGISTLRDSIRLLHRFSLAQTSSPRIRLNEPPRKLSNVNYSLPHPLLVSNTTHGRLPDQAPASGTSSPPPETPWWATWSWKDLKVFFAFVFAACPFAFVYSMWKLRRAQRMRYRPGRRKTSRPV